MTAEQTERILTDTAQFWATVEIMGHRVYHGQVSTETIASAAFLRVDVPAIPEHTRRERGYFKAEENQEAAWGLYDVTYPISPGKSYLIGLGSVYMITPVAEETARKLAAGQAVLGDPIRVVRIETQQALLEPESEDFFDDSDQEEEL